jgi:hypothetical protein
MNPSGEITMDDGMKVPTAIFGPKKVPVQGGNSTGKAEDCTNKVHDACVDLGIELGQDAMNITSTCRKVRKVAQAGCTVAVVLGLL